MNIAAVATDKSNNIATDITQWLLLALAISLICSNLTTMILTPILCVLAFLQTDKRIWRKIFSHPIILPILCLVAISIVSAIFSEADKSSLLQALRKSTRLLFLPLLLPLFVQQLWHKRVMIAFLATLLLAVCLRTMHIAMLRDPIFTSLFVAFGVYALAHFSVENKKLLFITIPIGLLFTYFLFFINGGRVGQYLFVMLFALFLWQRFAKSLKVQIGAGVLLLALLSSAFLPGNNFALRQMQAMGEIKQYFTEDKANISRESSMGVRLILAQGTLEVIKLKPWLGFGTGSFRNAFYTYAPESHVRDAKPGNPHNQYLLTWLELGIPGLLALVATFICMGYYFFRQKTLNGYLGLGFVACMAIGCTMNSWLLDFTSCFYFVFFAAMFASNIILDSKKP